MLGRGHLNPAMADRRQNPARMRFQSRSTGNGKRQASHRFAVAEGFIDPNETGHLQSPGVAGEIAVGQLSLLAQLHELLAFFDSQGRQNAQSPRVGDQRIKSHAKFIGRSDAST